MTSISKNVFTDKLDDIVNKHNNTYHRIIKIKPVDVNSRTNIDFDWKNDKEDPKFNVCDHVKISKCKIVFAKVYVPNGSLKIFVIKKVQNTVP